MKLNSSLQDGATIRMYRTTTLAWDDFVEDGSMNTVWSANSGIFGCPVPGDISYTPGLKTGDDCVQLMFDDNGPNDNIPIRGVINLLGGVTIKFPDTDNDTVTDNLDNCQLVANTNQRDTNNDGYGNICDPDLNNDGVINFVDLGIMRSVFFTNDPDADLNGDGTVNFVDLGMMKAMFFGAPGPSGLAGLSITSSSKSSTSAGVGKAFDAHLK